jgi:protein ImuB
MPGFNKMYACLYRPPAPDDVSAVNVANTLVAVAREFSPRYERSFPRGDAEQLGDDLVSIDVSGLERLIGTPRTIGEELRRDAAARGVYVHVALARTRVAAVVLALARPGVTIVEPGKERESLAALPIAILEKACGLRLRAQGSGLSAQGPKPEALSLEPVCKRWGLRTLGELAALPPADLSARLGQHALVWQAFARGEDTAPLVPTLPEERFESSLELEWPVEDLEPLSFVLTRLLEPLSARLERRDRAATILHLELRLVTNPSTGAGEPHARHLQLPSPIRDVRSLRTLLLLDLESHPPPAAVDRVTIRIDPTPGRIVQHTLFTRAHPTPEQLSTLLARLGALMGQDRIGAPATVDSHRPGAFRMEPFATDHDHDQRRNRPSHSLKAGRNRRETYLENSVSENSAGSASSALIVVSALRRCRQPVPARAAIEAGRPTRLTTDRRGFAGGRVVAGTGPWRTSGNWWTDQGAPAAMPSRGHGSRGEASASVRAGGGAPAPVKKSGAWDRDEWDVALADGAVYRVFRDRETDGWFIDAIVD